MRKTVFGILFLTFSTVDIYAQIVVNMEALYETVDSLKTELKKTKIDTSKSVLLNQLSYCYGDINLNEAINYGKLALQLAKKTKLKKEIGKAHANIAYAYMLKPDYPIALDNFYKAIKIYEEINDKKGLIIVYNNSAILNMNNKNYEKALENYKKALELNLLFKKDKTTSILLNNIGDIYIQLKKYEKAIYYLNKALVINTELKYIEDIGLNYTNIGICYINLKNYSKGIESINKSMQTLKNITGIYNTYNNFELGRAYYLMAIEKYNKKNKKKLLYTSIHHLEKASINYEKYESLRNVQESYFYLSQANKELGNYNIAFDYFKRHTQIKDSIFSEDNKNKIALLKNQRQIDLRDKQIEIQNLKIKNTARKVYLLITITTAVALLMSLFLWMYLSKTKINQLLTGKNQLISEANNQKDKFLSIIAHDLRDPFNGFLGLTELLAEDLDTMSPKEIKFAATNMRSSANNLFRLLENLLEWSKMEQELIIFAPQENNLQTVVVECIVPLKNNTDTKEIKINNDIIENTTVFADKNILHAVIRNVLSNAVKFTPKGGEIHVQSTEDENKTTIAISDSGIGMNPEMVKNLFRLDVRTNRIGTNDEPSSGLGLILCKEFVEKHGGKIWVESEEGKGTIFYFSFPKPYRMMYCA